MTDAAQYLGVHVSQVAAGAHSLLLLIACQRNIRGFKVSHHTVVWENECSQQISSVLSKILYQRGVGRNQGAFPLPLPFLPFPPLPPFPHFFKFPTNPLTFTLLYWAIQTITYIQTVQTTAEGTPFFGKLEPVTSDMRRLIKTLTYLLTYLNYLSFLYSIWSFRLRSVRRRPLKSRRGGTGRAQGG